MFSSKYFIVESLSTVIQSPVFKGIDSRASNRFHYCSGTDTLVKVNTIFFDQNHKINSYTPSILVPCEYIFNSPYGSYFKDYILELPKKFPNIDFVFRPHPLLFVNMINEGIWTKNDRDLYIEQLKNVGIEYSLGGDYFVEFVNSDALIHDCSSFMVEYLFLDKPCCFIVKDNTKDILSKLGLICLKCHDQVSQEYEIEEFIENLQLD